MENPSNTIYKVIQFLSKTPTILRMLLSGLEEQSIKTNEGPNTWSPFDVVGHLAYLEKTDWPIRIEIILSDKTDKTFAPINRIAHFELNVEKHIEQLLNEFETLRKENIQNLKSKDLTEAVLSKEGIHPSFGKVTLNQLLHTWVVHDLTHLNQIIRVLAKQRKRDVGPWIEYLSVLK
ncbi:DinB family protein [Chryseosolibacter indicus]|uniref:DinB family protein n=1 Tax=Chryseosolibacter indicus TaxID=2782351 RepID=A0ABS5VTD6_9BACT|nr:DinB family protein [Chryseosolibacter indicus]MBT1704318.1 DinB family protein [Chryseosolibacter indicus]